MAAKHWGPSVAGWLAGLPIVAGPILFFLAQDHGAAFASAAAASSFSAVFASIAFSLAYAHIAQRSAWAAALTGALVAWGIAAILLSLLPANAWLSSLVAVTTLIVAPGLFPDTGSHTFKHSGNSVELVCRMLAGAVLTFAVTLVSGKIGSGWSGLFAVFPVLGVVLAVFSHRTHGAIFAATLLRAMATGMYSFSIFCFVLSFSLTKLNVAASFLIAASAAVGVQAVTKKQITHRSRVEP